MTYAQIQALVESLGGSVRRFTFDDGYVINAEVQGYTFRFVYQNGDPTYAEDRLHAALTQNGLLEDDPSVVDIGY